MYFVKFLYYTIKINYMQIFYKGDKKFKKYTVSGPIISGGIKVIIQKQYLFIFSNYQISDYDWWR